MAIYLLCHGSTSQVFCCLARRVNLEVAQTLYNMGIPFAWVHNNSVTCSWLCGLRGASTSNSLAQMEEKLRLGVEKIQETSGGLGTGKVRKRRVQVIRAPKMFVTDVASCAWLSNPNPHPDPNSNPDPHPNPDPDPNSHQVRMALEADGPSQHRARHRRAHDGCRSGWGRGDGAYLSHRVHGASYAGRAAQDGTHPTKLVVVWPRTDARHLPHPPISSSHLHLISSPPQVWMSATLPPKDKLPAPVEHFKQRFGVGDDAVDELVSMQLNVGVLLVKADGTVAMPHSMCGEGEGCAAQLQEFVERLRTEPLLIKAYTAQAIVSMQDRLEDEEVRS